jgi:hypothetical protein
MGKVRPNVSSTRTLGPLALILLVASMPWLYGCGGFTGTTSSTASQPPVTQPAPPDQPPQPDPAPVNVTTYHNDLARTGLNSQETTLTPANVNQASFGKLASYDVDGQVYAEPLYLANVSIAGGTHNVVFVATQHDSVYAFDADAKSTDPLWHRSFIDAGAGITTVSSQTDFPVLYEDIYPETGITSTPVIDASTGTLYVVAATKENGKFFQRLHALDITTGAEKFGGPVAIQASMPGSGVVNDGNGNIVFDPLINLQRSALLLLNGTVYIAFASHADFDPFLGWVLGYDAQTLKQVAVFAPTPDGAGGSVWESGNGPAADGAGNVFVAVSNGDYNVPSGGRDYGDSILKLKPSNGTLEVLDWFTPFNFQELNDLDKDLGAGGLILLPDQPSGPAHLAIAGGKQGQLYMVNRDNLGHSHASDNSQAVQQLDLGSPLFGVPAVWKDNIYIAPIKNQLQCYKISAGQLTLATRGAETFGYPGSSPAVSSNGDSDGIVWALQVDQWDNGPAILHAYDANDCSHELYNSAQAGDRDTAGIAVKFSVPTVVNGKVYVGGGGRLTVYGLLSP